MSARSQTSKGSDGPIIARLWHGATPAAKADAYWDSMDSIRAFAGTDVDQARYYPEDPGYLLELEPTVTHYEVLVH